MMERNYPEAESLVASRQRIPHHEYLVPDSFFAGLVAREKGEADKGAR